MGMASWATAPLMVAITKPTGPEQIVASNVTAIVAGRYHSLFLKTNGSLWAMGYNASGQLGDGTDNKNNQPEQIVASNVTAIAAGYTYSLFLKNGGNLWAMGDNGYGQLGNGTYNQTNRPGANRGHQRHGDCRRIQPQPVYEERWQPVGHGRQQLWPVGRRHHR